MDNGAQARGWILAAALSAGTSVTAGAFAAHGFDPVADAKAIGWLQTGSYYQALHAMAILAVVLFSIVGRVKGKLAIATQWLFLIGSILFPGALYALALNGPRWLGAVVPLGGIAFIAGWWTLATAVLVQRPKA
jgi:uncharacterized membrane protein YgdD (TMEM256/DUF423 family)